jgi:hypothetical protein
MREDLLTQHSTLLTALLILLIIICIFSYLPLNSEFTPTLEPGYSGSCIHWSEALYYIDREICVWGIAIDGDTSTSGIYLHFSRRAKPYPDFAALLKGQSGWNFKLTGNNVTEIYGGHCIEVYGTIHLSPNRYNNETVQQPIMEVFSKSNIKYCN